MIAQEIAAGKGSRRVITGREGLVDGSELGL